ncbi:MAG: SIS domain-containing protein, partial [Ekhidna sp.]
MSSVTNRVFTISGESSSYVTAVANDYGYDDIYSRMIKAAGRTGDILIGISTSGNSQNVVNAILEASPNTQFILATHSPA